MMPQRDDRWLHDIIQSIDNRLMAVNTKLDTAIEAMITKDHCKNDCEVRKNAIDKRYFLGWGSGILVMVAVIGVVIKFA